MVMIKHKYIDVGATGTGETLVNALAGLGEKKRIIKSITYVASGTTSGSPAAFGERVRAYKNQEEVCDFSIDSFNRGTYSGTYWCEDIKPILLDLPLEKGDGFQVGLFDSAGTPSGDLQISYVDQE